MNDDLHALRVCRQQAEQLREMATALRAEAAGLDAKAGRLDRILRIAEVVDAPPVTLRRSWLRRLMPPGMGIGMLFWVSVLLVGLAVATSAIGWSLGSRNDGDAREGVLPDSFLHSENLPPAGAIQPPMPGFPARPQQTHPAVSTAPPAPQPLPPPPNNGGSFDTFLKQ